MLQNFICYPELRIIGQDKSQKPQNFGVFLYSKMWFNGTKRVVGARYQTNRCETCAVFFIHSRRRSHTVHLRKPGQRRSGFFIDRQD